MQVMRPADWTDLIVSCYNKKKMSGSKAPDYDTYGLLRTTCSHNPTQHSHIVVLTPHFYAHIGAGQRSFYH